MTFDWRFGPIAAMQEELDRIVMQGWDAERVAELLADIWELEEA